jgi:hypothetical protein
MSPSRPGFVTGRAVVTVSRTVVASDGLARVAAFLGAGLLLLAARTRYARLAAEADVGDATAEPVQPRA